MTKTILLLLVSLPSLFAQTACSPDRPVVTAEAALPANNFDFPGGVRDNDGKLVSFSAPSEALNMSRETKEYSIQELNRLRRWDGSGLACRYGLNVPKIHRTLLNDLANANVDILFQKQTTNYFSVATIPRYARNRAKFYRYELQNIPKVDGVKYRYLAEKIEAPYSTDSETGEHTIDLKASRISRDNITSIFTRMIQSEIVKCQNRT